MYILFSIAVAILLAHSRALDSLVDTAGGMGYIGAFIVGIFFTSIFTTAPAIVILGKLSLLHDPIWVVVIGATGAVLGDLLIFRVVHARLRSDVYDLIGKAWTHKLQHIFRKKIYRRFAPFMAAIIIASPLPDELGLTLVGMTNYAEDYFAFFAFIGNVIGITIICIGARLVT